MNKAADFTFLGMPHCNSAKCSYF